MYSIQKKICKYLKYKQMLPIRKTQPNTPIYSARSKDDMKVASQCWNGYGTFPTE